MKPIATILVTAMHLSFCAAQNIALSPRYDTLWIAGYTKTATFKWTIMRTGSITDTVAIIPTNRTSFIAFDSGKMKYWQQLSFCVQDSTHLLEYRMAIADRSLMPPLVWTPLAQDSETRVPRFPSLKLWVLRNSTVVDSAVQLLIAEIYEVAEYEAPVLLNELKQNYPNPFNPATTISFSLKRAQHVTIQIYDALGELVATVLSKELHAGFHSCSWTPRDVASGMYFCRLLAEDFVATRKLLVLR